MYKIFGYSLNLNHRPTVTAVLFLILLVSLGCNTSKRTALQEKEVPDGNKSVGTVFLSSPVKLANPYTGQPYCWIGGYPVSAEQIGRFSSKFLLPHGANPHKPGPEVDILTAIKPFTRMFSVVLEGVSMGMEDAGGLKASTEVFRFAAIGNDYLNKVRDTAPISQKSVTEKLPQQWVQANFQIKVVSMSLKEAEALVPMTYDQWATLPIDNSTSPTGSIPETGLIFPDSGFFEPFDDLYLFSLDQGVISRPIATGLGLGFIRVKEKKVFSEEEKNAYLLRVRRKLGDAYATQRFKDALKTVEPKINEAAFREALLREKQKDQGSINPVILSWEGLDLTYDMFREIHNIDIRMYGSGTDSEKFVRDMLSEFRYFAAQMVLGKRAVEEGDETLARKWAKASYDFYLRQLYSITMERIVEEERANVPAPADHEVEVFYEANIDRFSRPAQRKVTFLKSPLKEQTQVLYARMKSGEVTFETLDPSKFLRTPHGQQTVRTVRIEKGDPKYAEMRKVFAMKVGEIGFIEVENAAYIVRVDAAAKEKVHILSDIFEKVRNKLGTYRLNKRLDERLKGIQEKYKLQYNKNEQKGSPASETQDFS